MYLVKFSMLLVAIVCNDFGSHMWFCVSEMVDSMKKVAVSGTDLTVEERNLLSVGYKNIIGTRRASWRIISSVESKENQPSEEHQKMTNDYRASVG